jgi:hypothetical protein
VSVMVLRAFNTDRLVMRSAGCCAWKSSSTLATNPRHQNMPIPIITIRINKPIRNNQSTPYTRSVIEPIPYQIGENLLGGAMAVNQKAVELFGRERNGGGSA